MLALTAAAVVSCQGQAITAAAMHRVQATLAFTASAWSSEFPFLHLTVPVIATPVVLVVLLLVAMQPSPVVAVCADGSVPGIDLVADVDQELNVSLAAT